jgi:glycosyltransferase involved in cell wall biosynthesis
MCDLLRDPERRQRLATAAREHVAQRHSEDAMIRAYEDLYRGRSINRCAE